LNFLYHIGRTAVISLAMLLAACQSIGPQYLAEDRFDYAQALGSAWNRQVLNSIVRTRYLDVVSFLGVDQIVTAYTREHRTSGKLEFALNADEDLLELGYTYRFSERPTILYRPMSGAEFVRNMMTPPRPAVVFSLLEAGFPADQLLGTVVRSTQQASNLVIDYPGIIPPDPLFRQLIRVLRRIQRQNAMSLLLHNDHVSEPGVTRVENSLTEPGSSEQNRVRMRFHRDEMDSDTRAEFDAVCKKLGLDVNRNTYDLEWGQRTGNGDTLHVKTRSIRQIISVLSINVMVPDSHLALGLAPVVELPGEDHAIAAIPPLKVMSGANPPDNAYTSVRYQDYWFWIDDNDVRSKQTFNFLSILLRVSEAGSEQGGGQLVIPTS
jgi:hypothetical protein